MKLTLALLTASLYGQTVLTVSPQSSPFPLPKGVALYSGVACGSARVISTGQIRQAVENAGLSVQDPALNGSTVTRAVAHTPASIALGIVTYTASGLAIGGAVTAAFKSNLPNVGNARTWAEVAGGAGALGSGVPLAQNLFKAKVDAQASITSGVAAALMTPDGLYSIPAGGCARSVMFFGMADRTKPFAAVIP